MGILLKNLWHFFVALLANLYYRFPSRRLIIIGVTGTDGKTTTSAIIHHLLTDSGNRSALVATTGAIISGRGQPVGLHVTTPSPFLMQKLISRAVKAHCRYLVLECSSHGLAQYRLWGTRFSVAVVTNVTHDHLDYHKTYIRYLTAKSKLFERVSFAVLNKDDRSYPFLSQKLSHLKSNIVTYSLHQPADFNLDNYSFKTKLPGDYNRYNCLAAAAAVSVLGIKPAAVKKALASFPGVIGRMEEIDEGQSFRAVVDFAATPNALKNALKTLRSQMNQPGRLIAVFGSAGLRDVQKRKMMGQVAARFADISILTAEDPRTEDVNNIIDQIAGGFSKSKSKYYKFPDRQEAIHYAINNLAKKGDVVAFFGKAHEKSMCIGKVEYPWDERLAVRLALRNLLKQNNAHSDKSEHI